ncbi:MAG TPA: DUF2254 family protein [Chloroflexota bacterium]
MGQPWRLWLFQGRRKLARFSGSIWFLPSLMTALAVALFILSSAADHALGISVPPSEQFVQILLFAGGPSAARSVLSAISTAWAAILGVVFSVTLVTVQLTSTMYTAQLLSEFEKSRLNQGTLGAFVGTVVYALLVLKTVRTGEEGAEPFVPVVGTNLAIVFAVVSLFLLVLFLANVISFVRPRRFVDSTARTTVTAARTLLAPQERPDVEVPRRDERAPRPEEGVHPSPILSDETPLRRWSVRSREDGFVSGIEWVHLLTAIEAAMRAWWQRQASDAPRRGLTWTVHLEKTIGDRVARGETLAVLETSLAEHDLQTLDTWVRLAYEVESERRPEGDPAYGIAILGAMGEKAAAGMDSEVVVEVLAGLYAVLAGVAPAPEPAPSLIVPVDGRRVTIERPVTYLFQATLSAVDRVVDAALRAHLRVVPHAVARNTTDLLLRTYREGALHAARRLSDALLPLATRAFTRIEPPEAAAPVVDELANLVEHLAVQRLDDEAGLVVESLDKLHQTARSSPPRDDIVHQRLARLLQSPPVQQRPTIHARLGEIVRHGRG